MLTREIEGSSVKCGKYWEEGTYGTLRLRLLETNDTPERERQRKESETKHSATQPTRSQSHASRRLSNSTR